MDQTKNVELMEAAVREQMEPVEPKARRGRPANSCAIQQAEPSGWADVMTGLPSTAACIKWLKDNNKTGSFRIISIIKTVSATDRVERKVVVK